MRILLAFLEHETLSCLSLQSLYRYAPSSVYPTVYFWFPIFFALHCVLGVFEILLCRLLPKWIPGKLWHLWPRRRLHREGIIDGLPWLSSHTEQTASNPTYTHQLWEALVPGMRWTAVQNLACHSPSVRATDSQSSPQKKEFRRNVRNPAETFVNGLGLSTVGRNIGTTDRLIYAFRSNDWPIDVCI